MVLVKRQSSYIWLYAPYHFNFYFPYCVDFLSSLKADPMKNPGISLPTDFTLEGYINVLQNFMFSLTFGIALK